MRSTIYALLLLCTVGVLPASAIAAEPEAPPPLPMSVQEAIPGINLQLLGYGRFRKLIWDVFDASLWVSGSEWTLTQPFALELRYARDVEGADIVDGTRDQWQHLGYANRGQLEDWLGRLTMIFPDVKKGDQLVGLQLPGKETRFFHNGQPIGVVPDPDFGPAFFAIWLDPKTSQQLLREELLGKPCTKSPTLARTEGGTCGDATISGPST